jgi:membrane fusion protein, copper/silver efflux system
MASIVFREAEVVMKKFVYGLLILAVAVIAFLAGSSLQRPEEAAQIHSDGRRILYYVDPMNPSHTSDRPGIAPCGMKMEPVYGDKGSAAMSDAPSGTVTIGAEKQQLVGIKMEVVARGSWKGTLRALGRVVPDETKVYRINAATDGWIKKIAPVTTGSLVKKDDLLGAFYAPEFFSSLKAYLFGLRSIERLQQSGTEPKSQSDVTDANAENYRNGLRNLGMTDHQLDEIARTKKAGDLVDIRAPEAGFVLVRNITLGERFQRGTELFRIADLSRVWVLADIAENDGRHFQPGVPVTMTYPNQNKVFRARVSDVLPEFDSRTRTLKVRLEVDNPGYVLRPDMFVDVELPLAPRSAVAVPTDAVLDSGTEKTVFVDKGNGLFEPRRVETGWRFNDRIEITKGLSPGERVVVSGNFIIDSESRMKTAAGMSATVR